MNSTLQEIATRYKTDKGASHNYLGHYDDHLKELRDREFVLLEIGIGGYHDAELGGGSLRMWADYFPNAQIVGLDLNAKSVTGDRIHVYQGSQTDAAVLQRIVREVGRPLVVIDDGSHLPHHVRRTFQLLFPSLENTGVYIIEDLQTSYWPEWSGRKSRLSPFTSMAMIKSLIDGLNYEEIIGRKPQYSDENVTGVHCYHNMAFILKGDNREGSNRKNANPRRFANNTLTMKMRVYRGYRWARQSARDIGTVAKIAKTRARR